jgi:endogenous inhibitor of DNA gyrase (YacG/DUF329 family)
MTETTTIWTLVGTCKRPLEAGDADVYTYCTDLCQQIDFYLHPTKAFKITTLQYHGLDKRELGYVLNKWIQNAIGPAAEFSERIKQFSA